MDKELKKEILEKQGELLFTTLAEECCELSQACTKITRARYIGEEPIDILRLTHICEEIGDVQMNIELIKEQIAKEYFGEYENVEYVENVIKEQRALTEEKLKKIFLGGANGV